MPPVRREMVDVELVEDEHLLAAPGLAGPGHDVRESRPRGNRTVLLSRRVLAAAAAVIVVVSGAVVTALRADPPPVGALTGSAPSLVTPLLEAWRTEVPGAWWMVGGLVLTTVPGPSGVGLSAREPDTGAVRWTVESVSGAGGIDCSAEVRDVDGPLVVCQVFGPAYHEHELGPVPGPGRLLLLSAADGRTVEEIALEAGHVGFAAADGDLVLAELAFDQGQTGGPTQSAVVRVVRSDLRTGRTAWTTDVAVDFHPTSAPYGLAVEGGLIVLRGLTTAVLDPLDGRELLTVAGEAEVAAEDGVPVVTVLPHGVAVRADTRRWPTPTRWYARDGSALSTFEGAVVEPGVHDGSVPGIVLTSTAGGGSLRGVDAVGGQPLWSIDLELGGTVARHDGAVVVSGLETLRSVDLLTGRELWRSSGEALQEAQEVSDGSFVLVVGDALGVGRSISAVSLDDGSVLWRTEMPQGARSLEVVDGQIFAVGPGLVVRLD